MALFDDPPHSISTYSVNSSRDAGAGTKYTYTLAQSGVPCSINSASASERELFAQQGIVVSHTIAILASALTTPITRGMKVVDESVNEPLHVMGINTGQEYGNIPPITYLYCAAQLH